MVFSVCAFAEPLGERQHSTMNQTSVNEHLEDGTYKSDKNLFCLFNSMYSATLTNLMYNVYSYAGKVAIRAEVIVWNDVFPNWIKNVDKTKIVVRLRFLMNQKLRLCRAVKLPTTRKQKVYF